MDWIIGLNDKNSAQYSTCIYTVGYTIHPLLLLVFLFKKCYYHKIILQIRNFQTSMFEYFFNMSKYEWVLLQ